MRINEPDRLLTLGEVCGILRVSKHMVRRLVRARQITVLRVGHVWLFEQDEIARFIVFHADRLVAKPYSDAEPPDWLWPRGGWPPSS